MSLKTKTIAAAAIAAVAAPTAAVAHDRGHDRDGKEQRSERRDVRHEKQRNGEESREARGHGKHRGVRGEARSEGDRSDRGKRHGKRWFRHKRGWRGAFVVFGDQASLSVEDGRLADAVTLDPVIANRKARELLELDKAALRSDQTVTFGTAGDEVRVKYHGLDEGEALQPTDRVFVLGKVDRDDGSLDLRWIKVLRPDGDHDDGDDG